MHCCRHTIIDIDELAAMGTLLRQILGLAQSDRAMRRTLRVALSERYGLSPRVDELSSTVFGHRERRSRFVYIERLRKRKLLRRGERTPHELAIVGWRKMIVDGFRDADPFVLSPLQTDEDSSTVRVWRVEGINGIVSALRGKS